MRPARRPERLEVAGARTTQLLFLAALLGGWYALTATGRVSPLILPRIDLVVLQLAEIFQNPQTYAVEPGTTLLEFGVAFGLSLSAGLFVGYLVGRSAYATDVVEPLLMAAFAIPIILIFPICLLFFGIGSLSKIAFAGIYGFLPITVGMINSMRHVDRRLVDAAVTMGASRRDVVRKVIIPSILPVLIGSVRTGMILEVLAVIAGEILAGTRGIGAQISSAAQLFQAGTLYAWIVIAITISALLNWIATSLERLVHVD